MAIKLDKPVVGPMTSPFGQRKGEFHEGMDISVPMGTPVHAAADGTVTYAGAMGGYGLRVMVDHGEGVGTTYNHLGQILVKRGDHVTRGQVVAKSNNTGHSTGPHLHYEVLINGKPVNPKPYYDGGAAQGGGGTGGADVTSTLEDAAGLGGVSDALQAIGDGLKFVSDPHNWLRISEFVGGSLLIIGGLMSILETGGDVVEAGKSAYKSASNPVSGSAKAAAGTTKATAKNVADPILDQVGELKDGTKMTVREAVQGTKATVGTTARSIASASRAG